MSISIKQYFKHAPAQESIEFKRVFGAVLADNAATRAAFVALTAKLDTDFTAQNIAVTASQLDENYAATVDPAALTLVE